MKFALLLVTFITSLAVASPDGVAKANAGCTQDGTISVHCGNTPSVTWHGNTLWVVFEQGGHLYVVRSKDAGKTFSPPSRVNLKPEDIETNGENRPKIAVTSKAVLVSWTQKTAGRFSGDIRFARSRDGGKTFSTPVTINDDGLLTSHRFDSLLAYENGIVYLTWLDKRDKVKAEKQNKSYDGSALYYAVSHDHGRSFSDNIKIADNSCECCRIAVAPAPSNQLAVFWRHLFPATESAQARDHGFAIVTADGKTRLLERATLDDWQINACPHHGPAMDMGADGYHLAWFTAGSRQQGVLYGFYRPAKKSTTQVVTMDAGATASHPQVLEHEGTVYFAWKIFDGERSRIQLAVSNNGGKTWSEPYTLAATEGASDHPLLTKSSQAVYLAWHTQAEGLRLIEADTEQESTQ